MAQINNNLVSPSEYLNKSVSLRNKAEFARMAESNAQESAINENTDELEQLQRNTISAVNSNTSNLTANINALRGHDDSETPVYASVQMLLEKLTAISNKLDTLTTVSNKLDTLTTLSNKLDTANSHLNQIEQNTTPTP